MSLRIPAAATLLALLAAAPVSAAPITLFDSFVTTDVGVAAPPGATPSLAGPLGLVGGLQGGAISISAPDNGFLTITVTDLGAVGDVFDVFADGASLGTTAPVSVGGPDNSTGTFRVAVSAGLHTVNVWNYVLSYIGGESLYGGFVDDTFSPADLGVTVAFDVPEPASAMLVAGVLALSLAARRRADL